MGCIPSTAPRAALGPAVPPAHRHRGGARASLRRLARANRHPAGGSLAVLLVQDRSPHVRIVREVPADLDSLDAASELRLGREEAQLQAGSDRQT